MLAGGLRHPEQHFNPAGARAQATMLISPLTKSAMI
jgi:Ca2+/H+ antiporter